jgi:hypothetical protein
MKKKKKKKDNVVFKSLVEIFIVLLECILPTELDKISVT